MNKLFHVLEAGMSCLPAYVLKDCSALETRLDFSELVWPLCVLIVYSPGCSRLQDDNDHLLSSCLRISTAMVQEASYSLLQNSVLRILCSFTDQNRKKNNEKLVKMIKCCIWTVSCAGHNEEDLCSGMNSSPF